MNILVVGCGKLGSRLADNLFRHGHNVSVVDKDEDAFLQLPDDFDGITVTGMPMDLAVLRNAGIESCEAVATVTPDDNLNVTVSQIAKEFFGIENVVTRVKDPARQKIFNDFGLKTVCGTKLSSSAMISALTGDSHDKQITFDACTVSFVLRDVDQILVGRTIDGIPSRNGETVLGILDKNGHVKLKNGKETSVVNSSDKIIYARVID